MRISIYAIILMIFFSCCSFCENWEPPMLSSYYEKGITYLNTGFFTEAIQEFELALKRNYSDYGARISLADAYISRGKSYENINPNKAANDFRYAIFYLKYFNDNLLNEREVEKVIVAEEKLDKLRNKLKENTTEKKIKKAKELRASGEFIPAIVEYYSTFYEKGDKKDLFVALGDLYKILNSYEKSIEFYNKALELAPSDNDIHIKLGSVYEEVGNYEQATKEYMTAFKRMKNNEDLLYSIEKLSKNNNLANKDTVRSLNTLGLLALEKNNYEEALSKFQTALQLDSENIETRLNLGVLYFYKGEYIVAQKLLTSVLQKDCNNIEAYYYLANVSEKLGDSEAAISGYRKVMGLDKNYEDTKEKLSELLKVNKPEELLIFLKCEADNNPKDDKLQYEYAYELHKQKKYAEALVYYKKTIELNPKYIDAILNTMQIYMIERNFDEVTRVLNEGLKANPCDKNLEEYKNKVLKIQTANFKESGNTYYDNNEYEKAINEYNKIQPKDAEVLKSIGDCYMGLNDAKKAIEYYKESLKQNSKSSETNCYLGLAFIKIKNTEEAKKYLKQSLEINPSNKQAKNALNTIFEIEIENELNGVLALYDAQNYTGALSSVDKVLQKAPNNIYANYYKGLIYDGLKNYQQAIPFYEKAVSINPELDVVYYVLAVDYDSIKNYKKAVENYKKYLSLVKDANEYTNYANKRLKVLNKYE